MYEYPIKMNVRVRAWVLSKRNPDTHEQGFADVVLKERTGDNEFTAVLNGREYPAMYNLFSGTYFVYDENAPELPPPPVPGTVAAFRPRKKHYDDDGGTEPEPEPGGGNRN